MTQNTSPHVRAAVLLSCFYIFPSFIIFIPPLVFSAHISSAVALWSLPFVTGILQKHRSK